jgi:hypothetical protein
VVHCDGTGVGLKPQPGQKKFQATSKNITIERTSDEYLLGGHLRDGGDHVQLLLNGKIICDSIAQYGGDEKKR